MSNISLNHDIGYWCQVIIIEANTVPGMTPSTVLIHQVFSIMVFGVPSFCGFTLSSDKQSLFASGGHAHILTFLRLLLHPLCVG